MREDRWVLLCGPIAVVWVTFLDCCVGVCVDICVCGHVSVLACVLLCGGSWVGVRVNA